MRNGRRFWTSALAKFETDLAGLGRPCSPNAKMSWVLGVRAREMRNCRRVRVSEFAKCETVIAFQMPSLLFSFLDVWGSPNAKLSVFTKCETGP